MYLKCFCLAFVSCPCMAINVSVQHDGGFLPGVIMSTQCYYHRGTRLNAMERFVSVAYVCVCVFFPSILDINGFFKYR